MESATGRQRCGRPAVREMKEACVLSKRLAEAGCSRVSNSSPAGWGSLQTVGSRTRRGCSSLKTKSVDCTRRLQRVSDQSLGGLWPLRRGSRARNAAVTVDAGRRSNEHEEGASVRVSSIAQEGRCRAVNLLGLR